MFQALFKRAQATVDSAISEALNRVLLAIPFVIAVGFAMAAAWTELNERIGSTGANLSIAGAFAVIGLVMAPFLIGKSATGDAEPASEPASVSQSGSASDDRGAAGLGEVDREMVLSVLSAVGPSALPFVLRNALRNLPLVILAAIAIFVLMQASSGGAKSGDPASEPGAAA